MAQRGNNFHFDPDVVEAFSAIQRECRSIAARIADSDQELGKNAACQTLSAIA
jgi:hypothetical protein